MGIGEYSVGYRGVLGGVYTVGFRVEIGWV